MRARATDRLALVGLLAGAAACQARPDVVATGMAAPTFTFPFVDPAVPDAPTRFGGPDGGDSGAPRIVYPLDGAMHPINVGAITFQWNRGDAASRLFRITLDPRNDDRRYELYVPCDGDDCRYTLPADAWLTIAHAHAGQRLAATVDGTDGAGGPVYRSPSLDVHFTPAAITGGLYYWTAARAGGTTYRLPFGASKATPFIAPDTVTNPRNCGGCHSVSRDGKVISFSSMINGDTADSVLATTTTADPTHPMIPVEDAGPESRFTALNPDGSLVLLTTQGKIAVLDSRSGAPIDAGNPDALLPPGKLVTHPEWSPSGTRVAFTLYTEAMLDPTTLTMRNVPDTRPLDGEIATMRFDRATRRFSDLRVVVRMDPTDGLFHFYPSWSPDDAWLVFASGPVGSQAYNAPNARLRLAASDVTGQLCPGPSCFELSRASQGTDLASTWPKLSPFAQLDDRLLFVTFSSKMSYGSILRKDGARRTDRAQLWMAAIDLRRLGGDRGRDQDPDLDPSYAPFWLPFQDMTQANHLPIWTEIVACSADGISYARCGDGELCYGGACMVVVQ